MQEQCLDFLETMSMADTVNTVAATCPPLDCGPDFIALQDAFFAGMQWSRPLGLPPLT
jgi:hypothetical protein